MMTLVREDSEQSLRINPEAPSLATGAQRRRGLRIEQERPIKVFEPSSSRYIAGQTRDVSATGLKIELPVSAPVMPGKLLTIHVGLSGAGQTLANRRQMIPARIVWIDRSQAGDGARSTMTAGLEFVASVSARLDAA